MNEIDFSAWGWELFDAFNVLVLIYFFALNSGYLVTSLVAFRSLRKYVFRLKSLDVEDLIRSVAVPPVTVLVPAYNEEATCVESVRTLLGLEYSNFDIVLINDGSTDQTLERLKDAFNLERTSRFPTAEIPTEPVRDVWRSVSSPHLWVVDKENGGKADALNAGLNRSRTPLFCSMDADSLLERDALVRLVRPFLEDVNLIAAGGVVRIANGCTIEDGVLKEVGLPDNLLARFQVLEYLRAFLAGRMGWDALDATLVISGAFGMFRRSAVVEAGGFSTQTVGEDMELVVRLHRHFREKDIPYRMEFIPDPVAWTEAPETLRQLGRQRDRWQRGLMESLMFHAEMLLNPRYGRIGMVAFPYFFFLEMLGPLIEFGGYITFAIAVISGRASPIYIVTFFALAVVFGIAVSVASVGLEELTLRRFPDRRDLYRLFGLAGIENLGFRQLITFWRFRGIISALRNVRVWGAMERKGFGARSEKGKKMTVSR